MLPRLIQVISACERIQKVMFHDTVLGSEEQVSELATLGLGAPCCPKLRPKLTSQSESQDHQIRDQRSEFRGPNGLSTQPKYPETSENTKLFQKDGTNSCLLLCDMSQELTGTLSDKTTCSNKCSVLGGWFFLLWSFSANLTNYNWISSRNCSSSLVSSKRFGVSVGWVLGLSFRLFWCGSRWGILIIIYPLTAVGLALPLAASCCNEWSFELLQCTRRH